MPAAKGAAPSFELTNESHDLSKAWVNANWAPRSKALKYEAPVVRPARLGLGAKFVPHSAALAPGAAGRPLSNEDRIDAKLKKDLGLADDAAGGGRAPGQPRRAKGRDDAEEEASQGGADSDDDDDYDGESRTSSLGKRGAPVAAPGKRGKGQHQQQPPKQKQKRGPVVQAAGAGAGAYVDTSNLSKSQLKKQRKRQRKEAQAAATAAATKA